MDKDHILSEIKRTAEENGGVPLGRSRFEAETGINQWDWCGKFWSKWNDAVKEAGYTPNKMQSSYDSDFLLSKLIEIIEELGSFPSAPELRLKAYQDKAFPSHNTFSRFGKKNELIQAVIEYNRSENKNQKIIDICTNAIRKTKSKEEPRSNEEQIDYGFVYLMKSGKFYKIGRSKSAERREYELKILLPEKLQLIHKIKTDDPIGIEKYWHERFKDKRKEGEWFHLSSADVKAFRRRKFM